MVSSMLIVFSDRIPKFNQKATTDSMIRKRKDHCPSQKKGEAPVCAASDEQDILLLGELTFCRQFRK